MQHAIRYCRRVARKSGWSEVQAGWVTEPERLAALPYERTWGHETARAVDSAAAGSEAIAVHLEHREHPDVRFTVTMDVELNMVGVAVAPLRWIAKRVGNITTYETEDSVEDGPRMTARFLREINWGELHRLAQRHARRHYGMLTSMGAQWPRPAMREPRRPGPAGHGDAYYAAFAAEYVALIEAGEARPIAVMAATRGQGWTPKLVRETVSRCRPRGHGMLTDPPRRGVAGGELTPKALQILAQMPTG